MNKTEAIGPVETKQLFERREDVEVRSRDAKRRTLTIVVDFRAAAFAHLPGARRSWKKLAAPTHFITAPPSGCVRISSSACWPIYVEWHMRQAWAPVLFDDESRAVERKRRDPVAPAQPSASANRKKAMRRTLDGLPVHSFTTLMAELGTRCRHRCRLKADPQSPVFDQDTDPTPLQALIRSLPVQGN